MSPAHNGTHAFDRIRRRAPLTWQTVGRALLALGVVLVVLVSLGFGLGVAWGAFRAGAALGAGWLGF